MRQVPAHEGKQHGNAQSYELSNIELMRRIQADLVDKDVGQTTTHRQILDFLDDSLEGKYDTNRNEVREDHQNLT